MIMMLARASAADRLLRRSAVFANEPVGTKQSQQPTAEIAIVLGAWEKQF